ncbi:unnamed protein product [Heligmosomoides polygyrus]|uniref:Uncharacterized protein n=1 Tax=Heligmosomoides polygyrus TaxID=6339 RepID=A0A183F6X1_HELPZ|nr:unnamed protein product [Heligmosomoides polygyrus]
MGTPSSRLPDPAGNVKIHTVAERTPPHVHRAGRGREHSTRRCWRLREGKATSSALVSPEGSEPSRSQLGCGRALRNVIVEEQRTAAKSNWQDAEWNSIAASEAPLWLTAALRLPSSWTAASAPQGHGLPAAAALAG